MRGRHLREKLFINYLSILFAWRGNKRRCLSLMRSYFVARPRNLVCRPNETTTGAQTRMAFATAIYGGTEHVLSGAAACQVNEVNG